MGQRSQIYIAYNKNASPEKMEAYVRQGERVLTARYFQWNYGSRMVSRARSIMEWLSVQKDALDSVGWKIPLIAAVNFDFRDVVESNDIIAEWRNEFSDEPFNYMVFRFQDNNDGKLFISVERDGTIKYCFTDSKITQPLTAEKYMRWDHCEHNTEEEYGSNYSANCAWLKDNAVLMSPEELNDFISGTYSNGS